MQQASPRQESIEIDESRLPLIYVRFSGPATDIEFDRYLSRISAIVERRRAHAVVFDALRAARPTPVQRTHQTDWLKAHDTLMRQFAVGCAFVVGSALVRGALTAMFWVQPPAMPSIITARLDEAERWVI